jgi:AcrR family transcriptional regulator
MGVREERRNERRTRVLEVALSLLDEVGAEAITMELIARRMDASVGGLYRYFPSRQAIFAALQIRSIQAFRRFLGQEIQERAAQSPVSRLQAAFESWPRFSDAHPHDHRLLDEFLSSPRRVLDDATAIEVHEHLQACLDRIAELFDECAERAMLSPGDSMLRTHLLWAGLHGLGHFRKRDHLQAADLQTPALRRAFFETLLRSWGGDPGKPA